MRLLGVRSRKLEPIEPASANKTARPLASSPMRRLVFACVIVCYCTGFVRRCSKIQANGF